MRAAYKNIIAKQPTFSIVQLNTLNLNKIVVLFVTCYVLTRVKPKFFLITNRELLQFGLGPQVTLVLHHPHSGPRPKPFAKTSSYLGPPQTALGSRPMRSVRTSSYLSPPPVALETLTNAVH